MSLFNWCNSCSPDILSPNSLATSVPFCYHFFSHKTFPHTEEVSTSKLRGFAQKHCVQMKQKALETFSEYKSAHLYCLHSSHPEESALM